MVITPLFKTPERKKYVHYSSITSYLVLPNGFIINNDDKKRYKEVLKLFYLDKHPRIFNTFSNARINN